MRISHMPNNHRKREIYLYIVVRNAVRKKITIFIQYATNQTVGHAKRSAKCGAKIEKEPDNAPWV